MWSRSCPAGRGRRRTPSTRRRRRAATTAPPRRRTGRRTTPERTRGPVGAAEADGRRPARRAGAATPFSCRVHQDPGRVRGHGDLVTGGRALGGSQVQPRAVAGAGLDGELAALVLDHL